MGLSASRVLPNALARVDLDMVEKCVVACFMTILASRMVPIVIATGALPPLLLLISESMVVLFILLRRPTETISRRGWDWTVGMAGTLLPLLAIAPHGEAMAPARVVEAVMIAGFLLQISAKLTLRRSFGVVAANRGVKASGPYRLIRHPMYAGYALTHIGFLLAGPTLWNFGVYAATVALQVRRILAEERVLNQDSAYHELTKATRYRLVPLVF
jgi:protein-S-isoprenylcysteine O-methyltransferase Ste14